MPRRIMAVRCLTLMTGLPLSAQAQDKQTIRFAITSEGLITSDVKMDGKRFSLPKGARVRLVFDYADRNGNVHQFTVHSAKTDLIGQRMSQDGRKTSALEFTVGERGEDFYRISCDLPCLAMEELTDYLLFVDKGQRS